jgi:hypothetical protein
MIERSVLLNNYQKRLKIGYARFYISKKILRYTDDNMYQFDHAPSRPDKAMDFAFTYSSNSHMSASIVPSHFSVFC